MVIEISFRLNVIHWRDNSHRESKANENLFDPNSIT